MEGVDELEERMGEGDPDQRSFGTRVLGHETEEIIHALRDQLRVDRRPAGRITHIGGLAELAGMGAGYPFHQEGVDSE